MLCFDHCLPWVRFGGSAVEGYDPPPEVNQQPVVGMQPRGRVLFNQPQATSDVCEAELCHFSRQFGRKVMAAAAAAATLLAFCHVYSVFCQWLVRQTCLASDRVQIVVDGLFLMSDMSSFFACGIGLTIIWAKVQVPLRITDLDIIFCTGCFH